MAKQLLSRVENSVYGVTASSTLLIDIPYESNDPNTSIAVVLRCVGTSEVSGNIEKIFFILPIIYYANGTITKSIPAENVPLAYTSTDFSQMEITDTIPAPDLATFSVTLIPQISPPSLIVEISVPNTGTDWSFFAYVDILKEIA